jgi:thioredoxin-related protein
MKRLSRSATFDCTRVYGLTLWSFLAISVLAFFTPSPTTAQLLGGEESLEKKRATTQLEWLSLPEAFKRAAKENKPLLIDFYTDWCSWCKVMDDKTYTHHGVVKTLRSSFVLAKFNPEKAPALEYRGKKYTAQEFAKEIGVSGFPTTAFLKSDGTKIDATAGYIESNRFLTMLEFVESKEYERTNTKLEEYMLRKDIERDPNNPRFRLNLAQYYIDSVNYKKSLEIFKYVVSMDPKDPADLFALHSGVGAANYFFAKDFTTASEHLRRAVQYAPEAQSKARALLLVAYSEAGAIKSKESVEYLDKFIAHCQANNLGTQGLRQMMEKAPQFQPIRASEEFQSFLKKLP